MLQEIYNRCKASPVIVADTETTGLQWLYDYVLGIGLCYGPDQGCYIEATEPGFKDFIVDLLKLPNTFVFHNAKFDLHMLEKYGIPSHVDDTMLMSQLIDERGVHNLYDLTAKWLTPQHNYTIDKFKDFKTTNKIKSFGAVPTNLLGEYCVEQCYNTYALYNLFCDEILKQNLSEVYFLETEFLKVLLEIESRGVPIDIEYLERLGETLEEKAADIQRTFPEGMNINSSKQVGKYLTEQGISPVMLTPKGAPSWCEEAIKQIDAPQAKKIVEYRHYKHTKSTFVDGYLEKAFNGRVFCKYKQMVRTGRLACEDPNLQQVPSGEEIRRAFIGDPFTIFDYDQVEARIFGHCSNDLGFIKACEESDDVYADFAKVVFNVDDPYQLFDAENTYRGIAKLLILGLLYGMGDKKMRLITGDHGAKASIIDTVFSGFRAYRDSVIADAKKYKYVETIIGRKRRLLFMDLYKAVNAKIQGSAADVMKIAMVGMPSHLRKKMLLTVHDSLAFTGLTEPEIKEAGEVMCDFNLNVPLRVTLGRGNNWGEADINAKSKSK